MDTNQQYPWDRLHLCFDSGVPSRAGRKHLSRRGAGENHDGAGYSIFTAPGERSWSGEPFGHMAGKGKEKKAMTQLEKARQGFIIFEGLNKRKYI